MRYVGTRLSDGTATENWNELNFTSNGFLAEFKLAQANLAAHVAAGCGTTGQPVCSFAYRGVGTNTSPLPIYLGAFTAATPANATNAAAYTGTNWTNTTRLGELAARNPNPGNAANNLWTTAALRANSVTAGYPVNFWVMNPAVSSANVITNGNTTKYDSMQLVYRRGLSNGLALDANYVLAQRYASALDTLRRDRVLVESTAGVKHALKMTVLYDVPVGRGRRFATDVNPWLDGVIGGWSLNLASRVQTGNKLTFGNVRVMGMSNDELQDAFKIRIDKTVTPYVVYTLPQDIIDNTIKAFSVSATSPTGYGAAGAPTGRYLAPANGPDCVQEVRGDCAPRDVFVTGPAFTRFDLTVRKKFQAGGRRSFEVGVDFLNLFNAINFDPVAEAGSAADINRVSQSYQDPNVTFDPGGRLMQLVFRFNW